MGPEYFPGARRSAIIARCSTFRTPSAGRDSPAATGSTPNTAIPMR
jgi:hypothetical protein